jgi:hypothetical protein
VELRKQPLAGPATASQKDFDKFMKNAVGDEAKTLFAPPSEAEIAAFIVPYQGQNKHSGNTGIYYDFGTTKEDFMLTGLHGCTAAVIVVSSATFF